MVYIAWRKPKPALVDAQGSIIPPHTGSSEIPENGIVRILRKAVPYIAGLDYLVILVIVIKLTVTLFLPTQAVGLETSFVWLFEMFPTGGVIITGVVAAGLITSRLSSLESDTTDIATIKDKPAQEERQKFLDGQIKVCKTQRIQAIIFILLYVVLVSVPIVVQFNIQDGVGRAFLLVLIVGEMLVPLLNMRTFTIVEASMQKIDVIRNVMYQASAAAMKMLDGIGARAQSDTLSRQDLRALRRGRKGDVDGMLQRHQENNHTPIEGEHYVSLRSAITGIRDGEPLDDFQGLRYKKALAIARRYRQTENEEMRKHFTRGPHNQLYVSREMAGRIASDITHIRTRVRQSSPEVPTEPAE